MRLTDIETFVVGNPPPHFGGRYFVFVKITTDSGVSGIGEAYCLPFHPSVVVQMIEDVFERCVWGYNPHHIESMWRRVYSSGFTQNPDLSLMGVLSALEMACWDIVGKEANQPVYNLLGGKVHKKLRSYTYIYPKSGDQTDVYTDPVLAAERALEYVNEGFTAVKFDPAGPYTAFDGRLATKYDFARLLKAGSASILQMNLGRVGGLLEAKKIAGMAEVNQVQIAPHLYCGPIVGAANVQLSTCTPNFLILESIEQWQGFHSDILKKPMQWENGYVIPPTDPGLGVELNEEVALANPYTGDALHLEMADTPHYVEH